MFLTALILRIAAQAKKSSSHPGLAGGCWQKNREMGEGAGI